jgi:polysaccharide biosynthesis protein PslH
MSDERSEAFLPALGAWDIKTEVIRTSPFKRQPLRSLIGHLSILPRDVIACYSQEMRRALKNCQHTSNYQAVISSTVATVPYTSKIPDVCHILEEHNYMTGWMEERYRNQQLRYKKLAHWITWQKCLLYERRIYPQFQAITMVSERDRRAVEKNIISCAGRVSVVPNGVDTERNVPGLAEPQSSSLVFNGALSYYANTDAMRYFLGEILPLVHAACPQASLKITGRSDGADLKALHIGNLVQLTGYLEDVRPTVAGSWACVVPLRIGGGTRLKILEAMALGTPVVATSKAAEGLDVTHEHDILIADEPGDFARQTLRLLGDPGLRGRLAQNARALVEAKYSWDMIGRQFCELVETTVERFRTIALSESQIEAR